MNARIEKIRQLLTEIEAQAEVGSVGDRGFSALELPVVIQEIVDNSVTPSPTTAARTSV
jgi:hypothetical protein